MTTLNCTLKLSTRIPFPVVHTHSEATNTLGQWSGNTFNLGRFPLIILTNERTLLSVVIVLKDVRTFWERFLISLEQLLGGIQLPAQDIQGELQAITEVRFTRNTNRRTLGSMNELVHMVKAIVDQKPDIGLAALNLKLSGIVSLHLDGLYPRNAVHRAFHRLPPKWK